MSKEPPQDRALSSHEMRKEAEAEDMRQRIAAMARTSWAVCARYGKSSTMEPVGAFSFVKDAEDFAVAVLKWPRVVEVQVYFQGVPWKLPKHPSAARPKTW